MTPSTEDAEIKRLRTALKVIRTWASVEGALVAEHVRDLVREALGTNQCDGCRQGARLRGEMHVDEKGAPFMVCQKSKYDA